MPLELFYVGPVFFFNFRMLSLFFLSDEVGPYEGFQKMLSQLFSCWGSEGGSKSHSGFQVSKKQNVSSPLIRKDSILCGASVTER